MFSVIKRFVQFNEDTALYRTSGSPFEAPSADAASTFQLKFVALCEHTSKFREENLPQFCIFLKTAVLICSKGRFLTDDPTNEQHRPDLQMKIL